MIIHPRDNGEVRSDGHKYALCPLCAGEPVVKYGMPIGVASCPIAPGDHVHVQNLRTGLGENKEYEYHPPFRRPDIHCDSTFLGYRRPGAQVGIRQDI